MVENSILQSVKQNLGLDKSFTAYDHELTTQTNAALADLEDIGVGPSGGFFITGEDEEWSSLALTPKLLNMTKTYVYLKVRLLFDPPSTSFHLEAMNNQIAEKEWRLREAVAITEVA